jgi:exopolyphosphatase/guanosine-5'-triphosphate,3'-diphosphate pyrophosphatase
MQKKHNNRYAVIDIGTNSVLMLICKIDAKRRKYDVVFDVAEVTRLGQGMHSTHQLQRTAMDRTCAAIQGYLSQARTFGVEEVIAVGTSVLREGTNADDFTSLVKNGLDLDIEVISGKTEARFSYLAIRTDKDFHAFDTDDLVLINIGGGSTEFVFGGKELETHLSVNLGAVYLTDHFLKSDSPTDDEFGALNAFVEETLSAQVLFPTNPMRKPSVPVGIGGTLVNLASVKLGLTEHDPQRIHRETLSLQEIAGQIQRFRARSLADRLQLPGLEAKRADIIIAGAAILHSILKHLGVEHIHVSTRGVRYGVMYDRFVEVGKSA